MFARPSSEISEDIFVNTRIHFILEDKANVTVCIGELLCLSNKNQARQTLSTAVPTASSSCNSKLVLTKTKHSVNLAKNLDCVWVNYVNSVNYDTEESVYLELF